MVYARPSRAHLWVPGYWSWHGGRYVWIAGHYEVPPEDLESEVPETCSCGGPMLRRCPACSAPFSSTFAVDCEECGIALREPELLGMRIRKPCMQGCEADFGAVAEQ